MRRRLVAAAIFGLALGTAACVSVGREFPAEDVTRLEIGSTTQQDVRRIFGTPWRTGIEDGQRTWTYGHYRYSLFGSASTRDLVVRFDASGVVSSYSYNTTAPDGP
jgi:outer membrane protein assembly factor BamE (lipoprotein component of BamABCDE complex)